MNRLTGSAETETRDRVRKSGNKVKEEPRCERRRENRCTQTRVHDAAHLLQHFCSIGKKKKTAIV